jgi:cobyrinic acid a,c-diamide synthase
MNAEKHNLPFGNICAECAGVRYLVGVKNRNKYQMSGALNLTYNMTKHGVEVRPIVGSVIAEALSRC